MAVLHASSPAPNRLPCDLVEHLLREVQGLLPLLRTGHGLVPLPHERAWASLRDSSCSEDGPVANTATPSAASVAPLAFVTAAALVAIAVRVAKERRGVDQDELVVVGEAEFPPGGERKVVVVDYQ